MLRLQAPKPDSKSFCRSPTGGKHHGQPPTPIEEMKKESPATTPAPKTPQSLHFYNHQHTHFHFAGAVGSTSGHGTQKPTQHEVSVLQQKQQKSPYQQPVVLKAGQIHRNPQTPWQQSSTQGSTNSVAVEIRSKHVTQNSVKAAAVNPRSSPPLLIVTSKHTNTQNSKKNKVKPKPEASPFSYKANQKYQRIFQYVGSSNGATATGVNPVGTTIFQPLFTEKKAKLGSEKPQNPTGYIQQQYVPDTGAGAAKDSKIGRIKDDQIITQVRHIDPFINNVSAVNKPGDQKQKLIGVRSIVTPTQYPRGSAQPSNQLIRCQSSSPVQSVQKCARFNQQSSTQNFNSFISPTASTHGASSPQPAPFKQEPNRSPQLLAPSQQVRLNTAQGFSRGGSKASGIEIPKQATFVFGKKQSQPLASHSSQKRYMFQQQRQRAYQANETASPVSPANGYSTSQNNFTSTPQAKHQTQIASCSHLQRKRDPFGSPQVLEAALEPLKTISSALFDLLQLVDPRNPTSSGLKFQPKSRTTYAPQQPRKTSVPHQYISSVTDFVDQKHSSNSICNRNKQRGFTQLQDQNGSQESHAGAIPKTNAFFKIEEAGRDKQFLTKTEPSILNKKKSDQEGIPRQNITVQQSKSPQESILLDSYSDFQKRIQHRFEVNSSQFGPYAQNQSRHGRISTANQSNCAFARVKINPNGSKNQPRLPQESPLIQVSPINSPVVALKSKGFLQIFDPIAREPLRVRKRRLTIRSSLEHPQQAEDLTRAALNNQVNRKIIHHK